MMFKTYTQRRGEGFVWGGNGASGGVDSSTWDRVSNIESYVSDIQKEFRSIAIAWRYKSFTDRVTSTVEASCFGSTDRYCSVM